MRSTPIREGIAAGKSGDNSVGKSGSRQNNSPTAGINQLMKVCYLERIGEIQGNRANDNAVASSIGERVSSVVDVVGVGASATRHGD